MKKNGSTKKNDIYFSHADAEGCLTSSQHDHDGIEIYYLTEGVCCYFIDGESYTLGAGDTLVVPNGVIHRTNYASISHSRYLLNIPRESIPESVCRAVFAGGYLFDTSSEVEPRRIFDRIAAEYAEGGELSGELITCYATELLAWLARRKTKAADSHVGDTVGLAIRYINEGYAGEISLSALAERLDVTPEHLSRKFKAQTGFGFNEYLTLVRLQRAEYMLKNEPGRTVGEIAFAVGFNDSNYFSKRFSEFYGIPPKKARLTT